MKIAISTQGTNLDAAVELRFGRAASFMIVELPSRSFTIIDNSQQLNADQGAGTQAAKNIITAGATALISGHCGPKASRVLNTKKIAVYITQAASINQVLDQYQANTLELVKGH